MAVHSVPYPPLSPFRVSVSAVNMWIYLHILLVISCYYTHGTGQPQVIGSSQEVLVKVGDDVTLPCHIEPPVDMESKTVEWSRPDLKSAFVHVLQDGRFQARQSNQLYKQRTFLFTEELSHGNISLKLSRARLSDEGTYKCFAPKAANGSSLIQLRVGAGSQPVIKQLNGPKDDGLSVACDSGCWYPQPELSWLDSEGNNIPAQISVTVNASHHCYVVQSNVTVMGAGRVSCRVHLPRFNHSVETHYDITEPHTEESGSTVGGTVSWILPMGILVVAALVVYLIWKNKTGKQENIKTAAKFVKQHRAELILKVDSKGVVGILNSLGNKVTIDQDVGIKQEKNSVDQMMRLYREILQPGGDEVKAAFYDALKEHESDLFNRLATSQPVNKVLVNKDNEARPDQDAGEQSLTKEEQFMKKNRAELIQHVSRVMAVLDSLTMIKPELRSKIEADKITQNQMRMLYTAMEGNMASFYKALKQHEPHLLEWLENPPTKDAVDLSPEKKARFVEEHRKHFIKNVSRVMAILDTLGSMVHPELYEGIRVEKRSMDQMWILYREKLDSGGTKVKATFYDALKRHQPYLLKILEPPATLRPEDGRETQDAVDRPGQDADEQEETALLKPSDQTVRFSKQKLLRNPSDESSASSYEVNDVSIDMDDAQDTQDLEPSHVDIRLDPNRREKMVNSFLDLLFTEEITVQKMRELYEFLHSRLPEDIFYKVLKYQKKFVSDNQKNPPRRTALEELDKKLFKSSRQNLESLEPLPESPLESADMPPDEPTPEAPACHFVTQYKDGLVKRVKVINPILDLLLAEDAIDDDGYRNVLSKPTPMEKMEELYTLLESREAKDIFYRGLQEKEHDLLDDLKHPPLQDLDQDQGSKLQRQQSEDPEDENKPSRSAIEKLKGTKLKQWKGSMQSLNNIIRADSFVDKRRNSLIKRVTNVKPILDHLLDKKVITDTEKNDVMTKPKTVDQVREVYELLNDGHRVPKAKTIFYKGLKQYEKDLLDELI